MPHFPHAPEALLRRNDSKDAARTCRGITASGRACRRALASPIPLRGRQQVDRSLLSPSTDPCVNYCWQHQAQAEPEDTQITNKWASNRRPQPPLTNSKALREQSSIDTLVQKLGIYGSEAERPRKQPGTSRDARQRAPASKNHPRRENTTPQPSMTARNDRRNKKGRSIWSTLCCMGSSAHDDDDYVEIVRHKKRVQQIQESVQPPAARSSAPAPPPMAETIPHQQRNAAACGPRQLQSTLNHSTTHLLSLIPSNLSPSTTSTLLTELSKPISPYDDDGYIYIFWLTSQSKQRPGDSTARALLSPPDARPPHGRRISDVMTEYSFQGEDVAPGPGIPRQADDVKPTVMLKIGRASNITRRLNEWQRQCGYALNLVRWYPHIPSSSSKSNSPQPSPQHRKSEPQYPDLSRPPTSQSQSGNVQKCPHVHRVERLIHLELAERQVRRQCTACGKEHREWFEVEATQAGVKAVDETIRRWVGWAEKQR